MTTTAVKLTEAPDPPYLSKTRVTLYKGMSLQLYAYNADNKDYEWKSTDESIATVSSDGLITAKAIGSCRIYTVIRGKILVCSIAVKEGICGDVDISGNVSLLDAVWLNKYLTGCIRLNQASIYNADCNTDGDVNSDDLLSLLKYLVQVTDKLPYGG